LYVNSLPFLALLTRLLTVGNVSEAVVIYNSGFAVDSRRRMKNIDLGQTINTIANLGVVAGIVFLAFELRQNTLAAQLAATDSYVAEMNQADYFIVADPDFADLLLKGVDGEELTRSEELRVNIYARTQLRQWQSAYFRYRNSALDEQFLRQMQNQIAGIIAQDPYIYAYWEERKSVWDPEFNDFIRGLIERRE
jgi:hypothetical protein